jgi:hypothetical protein
MLHKTVIKILHIINHIDNDEGKKQKYVNTMIINLYQHY